LLRRSGALLLLLSMTVLSPGCGLFSPTAPPPAWKQKLPAWSPYLVVQPDGEALPGYERALTMLTARDAALGARIPLSVNGSSASTVRLASSYGLEVLGIIDNADLFAPDVAAVFDQYAALYPQVRVFEVGNEITTSTMPMTIDQYVDVLGRIYVHVLAQYRNVMLVSQATFGSGTLGAQDLATMAPLLAAMGISPQHLIIGINVYTETALGAYAVVLANSLAGYRVWVTETGVPDPSQQISFVGTFYPRLRAMLRAERIYWYALWAGDVGADSPFSLIHAPTTPSITMGPLFQLLAQAG
jgi:hypothetical protein